MVENLKKLRNEHGISQQQLADIVGVSQQSINKYENHNVEPDITTLKVIARYFNTTIDYLVGYDNRNNMSAADELLRIFNEMTAEQQKIFIKQGKAFLEANSKSSK